MKALCPPESQREWRARARLKALKETVAEDSPNVARDINPQFLEVNTEQDQPEEIMPRYISIKFLRTKGKEPNLESSQRKTTPRL